jgi:uncharacterized membrane protein
MGHMNAMLLFSLGLGVLFVTAGAVWFFSRATSATDLGSISRNWIMEHRNDHE